MDLPARNLFDLVRRWRSYGRISNDSVVAAEIMSEMIAQLVEKDRINEPAHGSTIWKRSLSI